MKKGIYSFTNFKSRGTEVYFCFIFAFILITGIACTGNVSLDGAKVSLAFDADAGQVILTIDSPKGVSAAQVKLDIPDDISTGEVTFSGFLTDAQYLNKDQEHRWYNLSTNGEKTASLTMDVSAPKNSNQVITLFGVDLKDTEGKLIPVSDKLPLWVQLTSVKTETTEPTENGPTEEIEQAEDRLSFEAAKYTNTKYSFSVKNPKNWKADNMFTRAIYATSSPDITTSGGFNVPVMLIYIEEGNTFSDAVKSATSSMTYQKFDPIGTTSLADGTEAYECEFSGEYASAEVKCFALGIERDEYWVVIIVASATDWAPYNKPFFSEIAHTLSTETPAPPPALTTPSSSGGKIAFRSNRDGNYEIYIMNTDGSNHNRLTYDNRFNDGPSWSPNGQHITFMSSDENGLHYIYVMDADGSNQTRLTNSSSMNEQPAWSPDGRQIVFMSLRDGNAEIYVMNADGSNQTRLTNNPADDDGLTWSPDSKKIAFASNRDGNREIYIMNADGTNQTRLTNNQANSFGPAWSPDNRQIAFTSNCDGKNQIYIINADGTNQTRLTNTERYEEDWFPAWSPDSRQITFTSDRDGNEEIYMMNADGSNQTRLTNNPADDDGPAWSPR